MATSQQSPLDWPQLEGLHDPETLRARVARVGHWFHDFELPGAVRTRGIYRPQDKLHRLALPESLQGKTVLDIGAWDGFYSFECERRGATVTSLDRWDTPEGPVSEGYAIAHRAFGSKAVALRGSVHDVAPETHGVFDVVLFLGVLYHLTNPFDTLRRLRAVTRETLIVETEGDMLLARRPALAFYPGKELNEDETNWFGPNAAALLQMCRAAGFRQARLVYSMNIVQRTARAIERAWRVGENPWHALQRGRLVVHATP